MPIASFFGKTLCVGLWLSLSFDFVWLCQFCYLCLSSYKLFLPIPLLCAIHLSPILGLLLIGCLPKTKVRFKDDFVSLAHYR